LQLPVMSEPGFWHHAADKAPFALDSGKPVRVPHTLGAIGCQGAHGLPCSSIGWVMSPRSCEAAVSHGSVASLCIQPAQGCPAGRSFGVKCQGA
jgi:hypothetical protein